MKKVKLIAIIMAVVTAGALFYFLNQKNNTAVEPIARTDVVVAAVDIAANTTITEEMLRVASLPVEAVQPLTFSQTTLALGMTTRAQIFEGEQVSGARLVEVGSTSSGALAYVVTPGMRAITIGVNDTSSLKFMVRPGDHVDLIALVPIERETVDDMGQPVTKTETTAMLLLQNTLVLAVDRMLQETGADSFTTMTLEVTPVETLKISLAENRGLLRAALRSPLDNEIVEMDVFTITDLADQYAVN